jgi:hypothetical protein
MKLQDTRQLTRGANYRITVCFNYIETIIQGYVNDFHLELDPDFQRAHVWNEKQQIKYLEYICKGGTYSKEILFNMPYWMSGKNEIGNMVLIDGKQRLQAVRKFINNELPVFGNTLLEWEDHKIVLRGMNLVFCINNLVTRKEYLQWYLDLNTGGTIHTDDEIDKVRWLLELENNP